MTHETVILNQLGDADSIRLPDDLRARVKVVAVLPSKPTPADLRGDVLLMSFGNDAIYELVERGVSWVHFIGTGIDRFDLSRLARGRIFTNSRGSVEVPISEWVLGVLLHHVKRFDQTFIHEPPARWPVRTALASLHGAQISLLGLGAIGTAVAQRALPFGAKVRALRHSNAPSPIAGVELVSTFEALIDGADHLVIAAPLTKETHQIVNPRSLALAKPGLHIVNIARGELIDQDALRVALDAGTVSAASLDAVTPEPLPAGHWLYSHPKVRLSPHISWSWPGTMETIGRIFADNLRRYLSGQPLLNVIDEARGY